MNNKPAHTDISDEELFELVKRDDDQAFRTLYRRYDKRIFGYCLRAFGDRAVAEDVFQTIIMKMFEKRESFAGGHFAGWLFTITRNQTIKELKKRKPTADIDDVAHLLNDESDTTGEDIFLKELMAKAVEQLPEEFKQPLTMKYLEGYAYDAIALKMNCSVSLAKVRVFRAKKMLRKFMSPYLHELK